MTLAVCILRVSRERLPVPSMHSPRNCQCRSVEKATDDMEKKFAILDEIGTAKYRLWYIFSKAHKEHQSRLSTSNKKTQSVKQTLQRSARTKVLRRQINAFCTERARIVAQNPSPELVVTHEQEQEQPPLQQRTLTRAGPCTTVKVSPTLVVLSLLTATNSEDDRLDACRDACRDACLDGRTHRRACHLLDPGSSRCRRRNAFA